MSLRPYLLDWVVNAISLSPSYNRHLRVRNSPLRRRLEIEARISSGGLMMSISGLSSHPPLPAASHCLDVIFLSSAWTVHLSVTWKLFDGPLLIFVVLWHKRLTHTGVLLISVQSALLAHVSSPIEMEIVFFFSATCLLFVECLLNQMLPFGLNTVKHSSSF